MEKVYEPKKMAIKQWAEDDRPREKLLLKGRHSLSDAELLAILIGSGTREHSAVELCRQILNEAAGNSLNALGKLTVNELMKFKGIGEARAITLVAAMELARRRKDEIATEKPMISCSADAYKLICPMLEDLPHEEFYVVFLNRANQVIRTERLSVGGVTGTVVDHRILFRWALEKLATGIMLAHNHPSGQTKPSEADMRLTRKVKESGAILDIQLMDHIIVGNGNYFSFADEGIL